jgi:hypothetical protein
MRQFHELFAARDDVYGTYELSSAPQLGKRTGQARTLQGQVDEALIQNHLNGTKSVGLVPIMKDNTCWWFAIDVDDYETPRLHETLASKIKKNGLPLLVFTTKSGGAHLYCFLTAPMEAKILRQVAARFVSVLNLDARTEIFPKQDEVREGDSGNWINLPYFGNERRCMGLNGDTPLSLDEFELLASTKEVHPNALMRVLNPPKEEEVVPDGHEDAPPCIQHMIATGVSEGGRNNALLHIGIYLLRAFPDEFDGMLHEFNAKMDDPLQASEVNVIINQLHKKEYQYLCKQEPMISLCDKAACLKRKFGVGRGPVEINGMPVFVPNGVRKVGDDIYYLTLVTGETVRLNAEQVMNHKRVREEIFKKHHIMYEALKNDAWHSQLNQLMEDAVFEPAPLEASGSALATECFRDWAERKLSGNKNGDPQRGGVRWTKRSLEFNVKDFADFVQRKHPDISRDDLNAAMHEEGMKKGRGKDIWEYPVNELWFELQEEEDAF